MPTKSSKDSSRGCRGVLCLALERPETQAERRLIAIQADRTIEPRLIRQTREQPVDLRPQRILGIDRRRHPYPGGRRCWNRAARSQLPLGR
jgi:hypothetical protein